MGKKKKKRERFGQPNKIQASPKLTGFPGGSVVKNLPANAGDTEDAVSIPGSGRFSGGGNGNPLQYSCLKIPWTEGSGVLQSMELQRVRHN